MRLAEYGDSAILFKARAWVKSDDFWDVFWDVNESMFERLGQEGFSIPFNQLDVHILPDSQNAPHVRKLSVAEPSGGKEDK